jgi:hypothetical protein
MGTRGGAETCLRAPRRRRQYPTDLLEEVAPRIELLPLLVDWVVPVLAYGQDSIDGDFAPAQAERLGDGAAEPHAILKSPRRDADDEEEEEQKEGEGSRTTPVTPVHVRPRCQRGEKCEHNGMATAACQAVHWVGHTGRGTTPAPATRTYMSGEALAEVLQRAEARRLGVQRPHLVYVQAHHLALWRDDAVVGRKPAQELADDDVGV